MDNHPIPQDVTGFQFRLIGSMTVKQFGYLAVGCVLAFITYYLPIFIVIKLPLIAFFAGMGFAVGFLPIEGRPMDAMLGFYLKALLSPNQFIYQKSQGHFSFDTAAPPTIPLPIHLPVAVRKSPPPPKTDKKKQLATYLQQHNPHKLSDSDKKEQAFLTTLNSQIAEPLPTPEPVISLPTALPSSPLEDSPTLPTPPPNKEGQAASTSLIPQLPQMPATPIVLDDQNIREEKKSLEEDQEVLEKEKQELEKKNEELMRMKEKEDEKKRQDEAVLAKEKEAALQVEQDNQLTHAKLLELEKSMQEMLSQKQLLEQELQKMKEQLAKAPAPQSFTPGIAKEKVQTQFVKQIPKEMTSRKGLPPPADVPNVLLGVVKDSRENILPNILIEVKDTAGNPVRAFKTNQLGQFASATPLTNGTYTIEFEDTKGKNNFDAIELVAKGEILLPLEVVSHDLREELRKELFS